MSSLMLIGSKSMLPWHNRNNKLYSIEEEDLEDAFFRVENEGKSMKPMPIKNDNDADTELPFCIELILSFTKRFCFC